MAGYVRGATMACEKCGSTKKHQLWTSPGSGVLMDIDSEDVGYAKERDGREFDELSLWCHVCRDCGHVLDKGFDT